ncbi:MAG: CopD family protein [Gammaproteobacteria bacterium]|nr:CopD family protein [Gammaproteobacteria bacterium]
MLWTKALHIVFMVTWFAGLFYLPRLFVYHAMTEDSVSIERFKVMERKLYFGIMTPGAVLTVLFGLWSLQLQGWQIYEGVWWMKIKLVLVGLLIVFHVYCGILLRDFRQDANRHGHVWYRWFNEIPVVFLIAIIVLAVVRPV